MLSIRSETPKDIDGISLVNIEAFDGMAEARLIHAIRQARSFDPDLSLVAVESESLVGHVLFSQVHIERCEGQLTPAIALAPMAVLPAYQRQGIGIALVQRGLAVCKEKGHRIVIVLGHSDYYPRFGFRRATECGIYAPWDCDESAFMVMGLSAEALEDVSGVVRYPPAFHVVE